MQFPILTLSLLATAGLCQADFLSADVYAEVGAPLARMRIDAFRKQHPSSTLTDAQRAVIDLAVEVIGGDATEKLDGLVKDCHAAFGEDVCLQLLADDNLDAPARPATLDRRVPDCHCSTSSDFCSGKDQRCTKGSQYPCKYSARGCGFLYLQYCNGLCIA